MNNLEFQTGNYYLIGREKEKFLYLLSVYPRLRDYLCEIADANDSSEASEVIQRINFYSKMYPQAFFARATVQFENGIYVVFRTACDGQLIASSNYSQFQELDEGFLEDFSMVRSVRENVAKKILKENL
ncbi:MAG: hypothetical protein ACRCZE_00285 [Candidatus Altimarinota bacterium]